MIVVVFLFGFADLLPFNLLDYDLKMAHLTQTFRRRSTTSIRKIFLHSLCIVEVMTHFVVAKALY